MNNMQLCGLDLFELEYRRVVGCLTHVDEPSGLHQMRVIS